MQGVRPVKGGGRLVGWPACLLHKLSSGHAGNGSCGHCACRRHGCTSGLRCALRQARNKNAWGQPIAGFPIQCVPFTVCRQSTIWARRLVRAPSALMRWLEAHSPSATVVCTAACCQHPSSTHHRYGQAGLQVLGANLVRAWLRLGQHACGSWLLMGLLKAAWRHGLLSGRVVMCTSRCTSC